MIENIEMATNAELEQEVEELRSKYNEAHERFVIAFSEMNEVSQRYEKVKAMLNKRNGKK